MTTTIKDMISTALESYTLRLALAAVALGAIPYYLLSMAAASITV